MIPLEHRYAQIEKAITYIDENFRAHPSVDEIAQNVGMSKYHFIRVFKEYAGVTPKQFLHCVTLNYAKEHIKESRSILESSLDIGFSSSSRLHELFVNLIGVTPREWRERGRGVLVTYGFGQTPFGEALIGFTDKGICYLGLMSDNKLEILGRFYELWGEAILEYDEKAAQKYLGYIFDRSEEGSPWNLGTNSQVNAWKALINLSRHLEDRVEGLIPCCGIISRSGAMSGHRWRIERGAALSFG